MKKQWSFRALAVLLVLSLLVTLGNQGLLTLGNSIVSVMASGDTANGGADGYIAYNGDADLSALNGDDEGTDEDVQDEQTSPEDSQADEETAAKLYSDGIIHIFNFRQLQLVGTDALLTTGDLNEETVGSGTQVTDENGEQVIYSDSANYFLEDDISLPDNGMWSLPDDFTGKFTSAGRETEDNSENGDSEDVENQGASEANEKSRRLYDAESDTVFIQNIYQLKTIGKSDRSDIPVMSGDWDAENFGTGQFVCQDSESGGYLTYSVNHNYVISSEFTSEQPEHESVAVGGQLRGVLRGASPIRAFANPNIDHLDGRDYFGQVTVKIAGTDYILIGSRRQLEAINYGNDSTEVYGPVYKVEQSREYVTNIGGHDNSWDTDSVELVYPGDADLISGLLIDGEYADYSRNEMFDGNSSNIKLGSYESLDEKHRTVYCTFDPKNGVPENGVFDYDIEQTSNPFSNTKYTKDGNYIVFRSIDFENENWTPLTFSGSMYGVGYNGRDPLWNGDKTVMNIEKSLMPKICRFRAAPVKENGKLDVSAHMGVGFFATLSARLDRTTFEESTSVIRHIGIANASVVNDCADCDIKQTLVSGLLSNVGGALGTLLDGLVDFVIGGKTLNAKSSLYNLLDARRKDPSSLATGAFAGRIVGDVQVIDCSAENVSVTAVKTKFEDDGLIVGKGGFVGYAQGTYKYDGLSNLLQGASTGLSRLLNVIPRLGLGDLITILLDNTVPVGNLIPVGYNSPTLSNCVAAGGTLSDESGKIGVGGFAGTVCGTTINNSHVRDYENNTGKPLNIVAKRFGGGFAGVVRDDIIKETLGDLGVIVGKIYPQSVIYKCSVENRTLNVSGDDCLGGFIGVQANSYAIDCKIDSGTPVTINAGGDCAGGFTGKAQLGSSFGMTEYLPDGASLLSTVKGVLVGALSEDNAQVLLALGGVSQSAILGCSIDGVLNIKTSGSRAGGIIGSGEAVQIANSSVIGSLNKYKDGNVAIPSVTGDGNSVAHLVKIEPAGKNAEAEKCDFVGGAAGYLISANTGSLLGDTLGLKSYLGFTLADVEINKDTDNYTIDATGSYAGGAIGFAIGGEVSNVNVYNLVHVNAENHVGGFVGTTGPDTVVGGNGVDISIIGIPVLNINNLIGLTGGIHTSYAGSNVYGISSGFTVEATGDRDGALDSTDFTAGGYAGDTTSVTMTDCNVYNLKSVKAHEHYGMAGGFVGQSVAGNLSGVSAERDQGASLLSVGQLVQIEADLIPVFNRCEVSYVDGGYVEANAAGGYAGEFRSGRVNEGLPENAHGSGYAVHNIDHVLGGKFAGGFGGKVFSGSLLRNGGCGLSLLDGVADVDISGISSITNQYIPKINYAGVDSPNGFTVLAAYIENPAEPATKGYAGGYIGYGSGMKVSFCNVRKLRHINGLNVPANLEEKDGGAYMTFTAGYDKIPYAVAGAEYAGGYIGYMNVGCANALGDSLKILDKSLRTAGVIKGLDIVTSTIEHSNVYGMDGGYSVLASSHVNLGDGRYDDKGVGFAGGFAGKVLGAHIQDSNAENFAYIVGEIAAGGYAGEMLPGDVADILDYKDANDGLTDLLSVAIETDDMVSLVQAFVPTVYNSRTTCIPCGGAVRAQSFSDSADSQMPVKRGYAGGYVGHGAGAQIWGYSSAAWNGEDSYGGKKCDCDAIRIRSVYGAEYAGGYVGLLEAGSTAKTGNLSLLGGVITANNLLSALNVVYPTIEKANVYGPLEKTDLDTWNLWSRWVGANGGFASELNKIGTVSSQQRLDEILGNFVYGYHVVAGRDEYDSNENTRLAGCAGGFAGAMHSGVIRYGAANNAKQVRAMRAAGGFAGELQTKGLAEFGSLDIIGDLNLDIGALVNVTSVIVPVIYESGVTGYQNGLIVRAEGFPTAISTDTSGGSGSQKIVYTDGGMAGGFVGACYGGQIGNRSDGRVDMNVQLPVDGAWARRLKTVTGRNCIGGFAGKTSSASVANVDDSDVSDSFLQKTLDTLIGNPADLVDALDATITVIGKAEVTAAKSDWGIVIDGEYQTEDGGTHYASCAGGFVGSSEATVFGARNTPERTLTVTDLRGVSGGEYSGGFFGLAHVGSVAQVGSSKQNTTILNLIQAGNISLLDIFRTYIYHATVSGVEDGIMIYASEQSREGSMSAYQVSGAAGGFGGALTNGTVERSSVSGLNFAQAPNYSGGFIGMIGTTDGIGVTEAGVGSDTQQTNLLTGLGLGDLTLNPRLLNVVGSTLNECEVSGFENGFIVRTTNIQNPDISGNATQADIKGSCAAGFAGLADMAHIEDSRVRNFKYAQSPQIAGGFVGRTALNYLVDLDVNSELTGVIVRIVNALVKALYLDEAQRADFINADSDLAGLKVLADGDLLYVNLLGLKIGASLCKNDPEYNQDAVIVTIGSSTVKLPCDENNGVGDSPDISVTLIEGNRTDIKNSSVVGIPDGYNVYAGGADDQNDGTDVLGYAGGFIGYNDAGMVTECFTELCDVIRGTPNEEDQPVMVGPFVGYTNPRSRGVALLEDNDNHFSIYRSDNGGYTRSDKADGEKIADAADEKTDINGVSCNRYQSAHLDKITQHDDLKDAVESGGTSESRALRAYISPSMEILMLNVPLDDNGVGDTPVTSELKDPCDGEVDITVNKVWRDFIYLGSRPESITVTIAQVETGLTPPDELITFGSTEGMTVVNTRTLILNNSGGSAWSTTWSAVIENQPVAFVKNIGGVDKTVYYQYVINEVGFDNYTPYYEADQASASAKIVNRYTGPLLPESGGAGVLMFYSVGLLLLAGGGALLIFRIRRGRNGRIINSGASGADLDISNFSDFIKYIKK